MSQSPPPTLHLPSPRPLPPDVRERALERVLAGVYTPRTRRARRFPALVAASVVVALVVGISVALAGFGGERPPELSEVATPPVTTGAPAGQEMVDRCAAAVVGEGRAADYPPTGEWEATAVHVLGADAVVAVDDAFACLLTPASVSVSALEGTAMGDAGVVRLGPAVLAVLNPLGRSITIDPAAAVTPGPADAAVRLVLLDGIDLPDVPVTVEGSYEGLLPEPAPVALTVEDRELPVRPHGNADDEDLNVCLFSAPIWANSRPELWMPVTRHDDGTSAPPALVARIGDLHAGFCTLAPDGPRFFSSALPAAAAPPQVLVVDRGDLAENGDLTSVLMTVPPETVRGEIEVRSDRNGDGSTCTISDGLAFCAVAGDGTVRVTTFDAAGGATEVPLPG